MQDFYDVLKKKEPFHSLSDEEIEKLMASAKFSTYQKGEFLYHEDEDANTLYLLVTGIAKNIVHKANGQQATMRFYYPGDLVGLMIMLTDESMTFSVQANEDCQVIQIKKEVMLKIMTENPTFSHNVLDTIGERMRSLYDEIKQERDRESDGENIALYRTRVSAIMDSKVTIPPTYTVLETADLFRMKNYDGVIVSEDRESVLGTVTPLEIINALTMGQFQDPIHKWMYQQPNLVEEDAFSYEALAYLKFHKVSLLPVMKRDRMVGMVSAKSFLGIQESAYLDLSYRLSRAKELDEIMNLSPPIHEEFRAFIQELLDANTLGYEICEMMSNYNDEMHRRIILLAEKEMIREGYGRAPVNYCFIVMGSEGRKEQAFSTDQDNGLIIDDYEHLEHKTEIETFFKVFAEKINAMLTTCGLPECDGGIMAKNEKWRRSLSNWQTEVNRWITETDAEEIRNFTIFMDFRPVYGDFDLARALRSRITERIRKAHTLQMLLMKDTIRFRVPLNPLGKLQLRGKEKTLDLKKAAIMQIVNGIRIFAMKYGVEEVNTIKRLHELKKKEIFHHRDVINIETSLHYLYTFRVRQNLYQLEKGSEISNLVRPIEWEKEERRKMREALLVAKRMQQVSELSFRRNRSI
ncbi:DUF294 nucleotidyltransferase-like domain-containing protein [Bacillus sp. es.036]|uniref:DUF294 nucleotidyltransferase-like domain-containing protein n=1 Tax=Bacillus sp. es.036 TaxID=1761764 RepID=UPI000BF2A43A|nr:DUF294 nucleotidyltransferase-like domain-containing protein [Bacillus sp. es.036]PFG13453.1 CBS domain-containing protein [Bacillus sp. es.036]